jgi:hypothetical protein
MIRILLIAILMVLLLAGCEGCFPGHDIGAAAVELPTINTIYCDTSGVTIEIGIKYGIPIIEQNALSLYECAGKIVVIKRGQHPVYYISDNVTYVRIVEGGQHGR